MLPPIRGQSGSVPLDERPASFKKPAPNPSMASSKKAPATAKSKSNPPKKAAAVKPWHVVKQSSIHSRGVFAARDIPKGTEVLEYLGEKISKKESKRRADDRLARAKETGEAAVYIFDLNAKWDLDGSSVEPNDARFINHSCDPNCEAYQDEEDRIFITAERDIKKGQELTYNYGFDLEHWDDHPCLCGSETCVGFIVDKKHWRKLLKVIEKRAHAVRKLNGSGHRGANGDGKSAPVAKKTTKAPAKKTLKPAVKKKKSAAKL